METALSHIGEWKPYNAQNVHSLTGWLFFGLAAVLYRGLRIPPFRLVVVLGFLYMSFLYLRHADLLGLFVPLLVAPCMAGQWPDVAARPGPAAASRMLRGAMITLALMVVGTIVLQARGVAPAPGLAPAAALEAAQEAGLSGPVLNDYNFGGFLVYSGIPTFIDGRADMFGDDFLARFVNLRDPGTGTDELADVLEEYDIAWTLTQADRTLAEKLDKLPGWERIHSDHVAVVHARVGG